MLSSRLLAIRIRGHCIREDLSRDLYEIDRTPTVFNPSAAAVGSHPPPHSTRRIRPGFRTAAQIWSSV